MLEQNTDRMLAVAVAIVVGTALIALAPKGFEQMFTSVMDTIKENVVGKSGFSMSLQSLFMLF